MSRRAVPDSAEFRRVAALPRRQLTESHCAEWARLFSNEFRARGSKANLWPWQGAALAEIAENHGAWLSLAVGVGKTAIAEIAPVVLGAKRPMLIIPANLRAKTHADRLSYLGQWNLPGPPARIVSREELALDKNANLLSQHRPDMIVIDESDELSNLRSAAVRRIDRYKVEAQDDVAVICMTGTPSRTSIMAYWHHLLWCLGDGAPVPMVEGEALLWDAALGEDRRFPQAQRPLPGPLGPTRAKAREWFARRLAETPGVVIADVESAGDVPLTIRQRLAKEDPRIDAHYRRFLVDQENPDGIPVSDPLSRWRMDTQLGSGYFQQYVKPPPEPWREARRETAAFVRSAIEVSTHKARPMDTERQVLHRFAGHPVVETWLRIKPTFVPETVATWLSDSALQSAAEWLAESPAPSIIWCGGVEYGVTLAKMLRLPYFGPKGVDERGTHLHAAPRGSSFVASWNANKKGHNLQAWRRHLIAQPPQSARWLEQIFGRAHRQGQTQPVEFTILMTSGGTLDGFATAVQEARFARSTVTMTQKILRADIRLAKATINETNMYRWAQRP